MAKSVTYANWLHCSQKLPRTSGGHKVGLCRALNDACVCQMTQHSVFAVAICSNAAPRHHDRRFGDSTAVRE